MNENKIWASESPYSITEGHKPVFALTFNGATSVSGASVAIYKNGSGSDISVTQNMTTGSWSYNGNVATTPIFQNFTGGNRYTISITITVDSVTEVRKIEIDCQKAKDLQ